MTDAGSPYTIQHPPYVPESAAPLSDDAYAMLSQANLLRIRGLWPDAVEMCMIAMKLSPGNAAAQSLLGDIYENMGQVDDAIRWYQLALDANPGSVADRQKLDRLIAAQRAAAAASPDLTINGTPLPATPVAAPHAAAVWLRAAAILSALAVVAVIAYALSQTPRRPAPALPTPTPNVSADPILLSRSASPTIADNPQNTGGTTEQTGPGSVRDASEQALVAGLHSMLDTEDGSLRIVDAQSDPRAGRVIATVLLRPAGSAPATRDVIIRAAAHTVIALTRSTITSGYSEWTVRVLMQPSDAAPAVTYIADATRVAAVQAPPNLTDLTTQQVESLFTNEWWSPNAPPG